MNNGTIPTLHEMHILPGILNFVLQRFLMSWKLPSDNQCTVSCWTCLTWQALCLKLDQLKLNSFMASFRSCLVLIKSHPIRNLQKSVLPQKIMLLKRWENPQEHRPVVREMLTHKIQHETWDHQGKGQKGGKLFASPVLSLILDKCFISNKPCLLYVISVHLLQFSEKENFKPSKTLQKSGYADQNKLL